MQSHAIISYPEKRSTESKESALLRFSLAIEYVGLRKIWVAAIHLKCALDLVPGCGVARKLPCMALTDGAILKKPLSLFGAASLWYRHAAIGQQ